MTLKNIILLTLFSLIWLSGCAHTPPNTTGSKPALAYTAAVENSLLARFAPILVSQNSDADYNRIGSVKAEFHGGEERVFVDPKQAAFYVSHREFTSQLGSTYTNLIYRVHFDRIPAGYLGSGRNTGLIIVITLNKQQQPVLITTVHTCGCYLAFTPTSYLDKSAFPKNWDWQKNNVYGESLPAVLALPPSFSDDTRPLIRLREGNHRVMDVSTIDIAQAKQTFTLSHAELIPIKELRKLPLPDTSTTSFYHSEGIQKGYVKGATKPWEMLLMSWWTFDLFIGRDKEFGPSEQTGTVFYTSLKPWNRSASDMWQFDQFLAFWGWRL